MNAVVLGTLEERQSSWQVAHEALSRLARARAAADAEEGRWLLAAERAAVHVHLGYGSFSEYVERLFGYQPRSLQEKLRVAEALEGLPALARALSSGELSWSATRELTRVVVPDTEQEWLAFAQGKTVRQLEQVLAHRHCGDTPACPPDLSARRHTLRFDVAAETLALFREALSELRRRAGAQLDDDAALLELARCVLGGPSDEGRASYQVVLNVCPDCGNGRQQAAGGLVPVGPDVISMAQCDAQHISLGAGSLAAPNSALANAPEPDERASGSEPAMASQDGVHVGADVLPRATQTIPPALRRAVFLRDQHRCQVPGCSHSRWVDVHHIALRSEGGGHSLANLVCVCGAHHRGPPRPAQPRAQRKRRYPRAPCRRHGIRPARASATARAAGEGLLCIAPSRLSRSAGAYGARVVAS